MSYPQFEAKKIAMKQTKDGYVMSLAIHPDDIPDDIIKDFVGSRYMVVMVRLGDDEKPVNRDEYAGAQMVKLAGMLCRDKHFWEFFEVEDEAECVIKLQFHLNISSRAILKENLRAQEGLKELYGEYKEWKN